ncbi:MAG: prepilin-type N-terminal cleavage/methylation domain-containing protein [Deltaproteobacteria bacterium]|nr:prepilin-type N-terminal cleavage/methylation domain-containing protein [Deltaproteobacteria bacterium]
MLKKMKMKRDEGGFTLIELLIVVAIIAILAAIAIPQFSGYRSRSVRASMIADARNTATAMEAYFTDSGTYLPANGISTTGPTAFGAATALAGVRPSRNNLVAIASAANAYTITVTNANGTGGGFTSPMSLFSNGVCTWASAQNC